MGYKENLDNQIREEYGKLVYTYTCHWEECGLLSRAKTAIKTWEIILTAASTTGIVGQLITNNRVAGIVGAICSAIALAITLYAKENDVESKIYKHQENADDLWQIREKYISLLTDIPVLDESEIRIARDALIVESALVYKKCIPTSKKAYSNAQEQLKDKGYQYFERDEVNRMLPEHLRK